MAVRSFITGMPNGRKPIGITKTPPTPGSKTQKRKANKAAHMRKGGAK